MFTKQNQAYLSEIDQLSNEIKPTMYPVNIWNLIQ